MKNKNGGSNWSLIISITISVIIVALIGIRLGQYFSSKNKVEVSSTIFSHRPLDIVFGDSNAPLAIFMYSSYSCSYCKLFFTDVFPNLEKEYINNGKVKLVMRLTVKSNSIDTQNAMRTAVCVNKYGDYTYLHELLLSNSKVVVTNDFRDMVNEFIEKDIYVAECILGGEAEEYLAQNVADFETLKLKGTPSFIIDNQVYTGYQNSEKFNQIITYHLNKLKR
ncbi:MAG: thioredoxin domain-containing protein [Bacteroidales bacterium]|nr:thioredoxin domain-containing protein [Tenuifilaceae bacterium]